MLIECRNINTGPTAQLVRILIRSFLWLTVSLVGRNGHGLTYSALLEVCNTHDYIHAFVLRHYRLILNLRGAYYDYNADSGSTALGGSSQGAEMLTFGGTTRSNVGQASSGDTRQSMVVGRYSRESATCESANLNVPRSSHLLPMCSFSPPR